jgi:hypothetical protein
VTVLSLGTAGAGRDSATENLWCAKGTLPAPTVPTLDLGQTDKAVRAGLPVAGHPSLLMPPRGQWRTIRGDDPRVMVLTVASNPVQCRVFFLAGQGGRRCVLDAWARSERVSS